MAPRTEDIAWEPPMEEDGAIESAEPMKPITEELEVPLEETTDEEESSVAEGMVMSTTTFCSNIFTTLLGKNKTCAHCQQTIMNSDPRVKEKAADGSKTFYHEECKTNRMATEAQMKVVLEDLMEYFRQLEMTRLAEEEAKAVVEQPKSKSRGIGSIKKKGMMAKLFSGCRNNKATI